MQMSAKEILNLDPEEIISIVTSSELSDKEVESILQGMLEEVLATMKGDFTSCNEQVRKLNIICRGLRKYAADQNMMKYMYYGHYDTAVDQLTILSSCRRGLGENENI